jgi:hypothetical protein
MHRRIENMVAAFERGQVTRRQLVGQLALLAAGTACLPRAVSGAAPQSAGNTFTATGLDHIALDVTDLARSRDFYRKHLALEPMSESASSIFMRCGKHFVALFKSERPAMDHYCYAIEHYEPADAGERLKAAGLKPERRADRVYFKDPDGLEVQVAAPNRR